MDFYSSKTPDSYKLIRGIFIMIMGTAFLVVILFFTLSIHQTATAKNGELIAENVAIQYLAPYDAEIEKVLVQEGARVSKGDTLIILRNEELLAEYKKTESSLATTIKNIEIYKKQLENLDQKLYRQKNVIQLRRNKYSNDKKGQNYEVNNLKKQLAVLEGKLEISRKSIQKDYLLFVKGAISEKEYHRRYKTFLDDSNQLTEMKNQAYQGVNKNDEIESNLAEDLSTQELTILKTESENLEHQKALEEEEDKKAQLMDKMDSQQKELNQLTIISEIDGYATELFNTQKGVNLVPKKQALLIVTPLTEEKFYANFKVSEKEIKDIQEGQAVHMRLAAYNHYKYGILKGTITHINKEMEDKKDDPRKDLFYVLVDIPSDEAAKMDIKSGFKVSGEIIIGKVKLYKYFIRSMFKKI